jgi:hypothetical protein
MSEEEKEKLIAELEKAKDYWWDRYGHDLRLQMPLSAQHSYATFMAYGRVLNYISDGTLLLSDESGAQND